ncbi:Piwi domain-containing protein [Haematococcus lacustris]
MSRPTSGRGGGEGRGRSQDRGGGRGPGGPPQGGGRGGGGGYPQGGGGPPRASSAPASGRMSQAEAELSIKTMLMGLRQPTTKETKTPEGLTARPGLGEIGQKVKVLANHFKVADIPRATVLYQYDVAMVRHRAPRPDDTKYGGPLPSTGPPPMPDRNRCIAIMKAFATRQRWPQQAWAYDGQKILYANKAFIPPTGSVDTVDILDEGPGVAAGDAARKPAGAKSTPTTYEVAVRPIQPSPVLPAGEQLAAVRSGQLGQMPRESLHALDVALRQTATQDPNNRMVARGVYTSENRSKIGFGMEAWHGYTQSLNLTQCGLTVSMDAAVIAMPVMEDLTKFVEEVLRTKTEMLAVRELTSTQVEALNAACSRKAVTIQVNHRANGKLRHRVRGFTPQSAAKGLFEMKDGTKTTVVKYFKQAYNMTLTYPNLPCVIVGSRSRPEWLPIEVCRIVPDSGGRGLGPEETTEILRQAAVPPEARKKRIMDTLTLKAKLQSDLVVKSFGMSLAPAPQMVECMGRVLPVPSLQYGGGKYVDPGMKGDWNIMNTRLFKAVAISSFAVVCYVPESKAGQAILGFLEELRMALEEKGISVQLPAYPPVVFKTRVMSDEDALRTAMQEAQTQLGKPAQILFIIEERENQVYSEVKRICDCVIGVQSQVLVAPNIKLGAPPGGMGRKMAGVALKVNTKLGGDNTAITGNIGIWCPAVKNPSAPGVVPKVMLLGADVSHPTNLPGQGKTETTEKEPSKQPDMPSVAAIVGSINPDCTRYACRIYAQDPLKEMVTDMAKAVFELLGLWGTTNKGLPDVILMFRDGVSEGQFSQVLDYELKAIQEACSKFTVSKQPYKPRITFVTVQKRHGTRFFPGDAASVDQKSGNVRPGVVIDREVCSTREFDYYLNSHAGIQGTNKAAKYSVLSDDVGFTADSMQLLTYWLCHTFCRCTRTVSYCPPAYYAHHAAFRGRCWLRKEEIFSDTASASSGFSGGASSQSYKWDFAKVLPAIRDTMYWI